MEKEKILDKMRELRDVRDLQILSKELENINLDVDYKKDLAENKVLDVKYLGQIEQNVEVDGKEEKVLKDIYLLIEQQKDKDGNLIQIEKYYNEDLEFLAGNNLTDGYGLMLDPKHMDQRDLLEQLQNLDKEGLLDLNEMDQERLEQIANVLGIEKDDIKKVASMNKNQLEEAEEQLENEENLDSKKIDEGKERKEFSKNEIEKISTKNEIKINQKVTDKDTMASVLGVQDKGYQKIAIIYSDKLKGNSNTTRFSFVGIKEDGSAEKIESLEQGYGNTPSKTIYGLNRDGSQLEEQKASSIFKIKGKKEVQLAVEIGAMGTIEPKFVRTPAQDNQKAISVPIETSQIKPTTREVRELMNERRNVRVSEEIEKIENHKEHGCDVENLKLQDYDDNLNNNTHTHLEDEELEKYANEALNDEDIENVFTKREVKEMIEKYLENGKQIDEAIDLIRTRCRKHENQRTLKYYGKLFLKLNIILLYILYRIYNNITV